MSARSAISAPRIFDGTTWHNRCAVLHGSGTVLDVVPVADLPDNVSITRIDSGMLVPGFVDLQVNGGGGVLLNDDPSVESIRTICEAHAQFGTTALLPTLITDTVDNTEKAIEAAAAANAEGIPGCMGLHLEGPHLSQARRGAHDPSLVRPATDQDIERLLAAGQAIPNLLVTVAPEAVSDEQIRILSDAGILISLGHSDANCPTAVRPCRPAHHWSRTSSTP